jgi:XTP/dITP diphosphohydrolase
VLATRNRKKLTELRRITEASVPGIEVLGLDDVEAYDEPAETEPTFAGNALIKARAAVGATGLPALADDSGLCVDALNGMPGVLSARWSGRAKDDEANNALLLAQLADVPDSRRGSAFFCAMALVLPDGTETVETGELRGSLLRGPRGAAASATTRCSWRTARRSATPSSRRRQGRHQSPRSRTARHRARGDGGADVGPADVPDGSPGLLG